MTTSFYLHIHIVPQTFWNSVWTYESLQTVKATWNKTYCQVSGIDLSYRTRVLLWDNDPKHTIISTQEWLMEKKSKQNIRLLLSCLLNE